MGGARTRTIKAHGFDKLFTLYRHLTTKPSSQNNDVAMIGGGLRFKKNAKAKDWKSCKLLGLQQTPASLGTWSSCAGESPSPMLFTCGETDLRLAAWLWSLEADAFNLPRFSMGKLQKVKPLWEICFTGKELHLLRPTACLYNRAPAKRWPVQALHWLHSLQEAYL